MKEMLLSYYFIYDEYAEVAETKEESQTLW